MANTDGDWAQAAAEWRRGLELARELGSTPFTAVCLAGMASVLTARGEPRVAARLLGAVNGIWRDGEQLEFYRRPFHAADEPAQAATRAALSTEAFAQAWAEGQALSLDQAVALALEALPAETTA